MIERNQSQYQIEQNNKEYILSTSLIYNKIKIVCQDPSKQIFEGQFTMNNLIQLSKYFQPNHTVEQIQKYLNGIIENQRVAITQNNFQLNIILYLVNNDQIKIPLTKKVVNNVKNYNNYQYNAQNIPTTTQYLHNQQNKTIIMNPSNQYYNINNNNIIQEPSSVQDQYLYQNNANGNVQYLNQGQKGNINQEIENIKPFAGGIQRQQINIKNANQSANIPNGVQIPKVDSIHTNYIYQQYDENKIGKLEDDTNIIRVEQEKLKNDMKRLIEEASRYKEENKIFRTDIEKLSNENVTLKNENNNFRNQIINYQKNPNENKGLKEENNSLRNQIVLLNKDLNALENQNDQIRKMYEDLENENKGLKEESNSLTNQVDLLNKDLEAFENQNNQIRKMYEDLENENKVLKEENNSLKNQVELINKDSEAFENQNNQIRKMYEDLEKENNTYKTQIDELNKENELLRGQVEDLNNNFNLINNELENIKNENNLVRNNIDQQKNNDELTNKLIEENKIYKQKAEENILLRKQIEELQYQLQIGQERQEEDEQGKEVKGDIIHDIKELEMITKKINKDENKKIIINLLYKASVDSDKASAFHEKCDQAQNTIVLVETKNGKRFGGYTTCSWSGNCVDKNDPQAFIFSFDKMKTYDNIPGDEAIGCYPKFGPIFLGCQIKIFDNAFSKGGTTFEKELNFNTEEDYELTGGDRTFEIKDIEVYEVLIE